MRKTTPNLQPDRKTGKFYLFGQAVQPPQTSIHPRVRNGRTVFPKSNTAKARKS